MVGVRFIFWVCADAVLIWGFVHCCDHIVRLAKGSRSLAGPVLVRPGRSQEFEVEYVQGARKGGSGQNWSGVGSMVMLGVTGGVCVWCVGW